MDKSAIEAIQQSQTVKEIFNAIATDTPVAVLPVDFNLESLERFMERRSRFRGKMSTSSIEDYVRYVAHHDADGAACFVDVENMKAVSIFNLGTEEEPGHADFTATLALQKTAEFDALLKLNGNKQTQKELAEWCEDWAQFITFRDADRAAIDIKRGVSAIRKLTIEALRKEEHATENFSGRKSTLEQIEAKSESGIPAGLTFTCATYVGLNARDFECRLSIITGGDAPRLVVRIKRLEVEVQAIAMEFRNLLATEFSNLQLQCCLGAFNAGS